MTLSRSRSVAGGDAESARRQDETVIDTMRKARSVRICASGVREVRQPRAHDLPAARLGIGLKMHGRLPAVEAAQYRADQSLTLRRAAARLPTRRIVRGAP